MPPVSSITVAAYSSSGELRNSQTIDTGSLDQTHGEYFAKKFKHLTGDMELPLEDRMPGDVEHLEYRIGSDLNGGYVLYYFHDEVIFASLLLSGADEIAETELMQVFKFLLLDSNDEEDPTEEEIEEVLSRAGYDFHEIETRPAVFEVHLAENKEDSDIIEQVEKINRVLAKSFFEIDRPTTS